MKGRAARRGVLLASLVMALVCGCRMGAVENRFIYFPTRELVGTPRDVGLDYTDIRLTTADGVLIHGWWVPAEPERAVILFFHGNAGNISDRIESVEIFHELGLSVFIIDYRGYGRSTGVPSEEGTYRDAEAAWRYLTQDRGIDPGRIVVFGRSLGAAVACELAATVQPRALILESAFTSIPAMASRAIPFLPLGPFLRTRYENLKKISRVRCPVLIVHSPDDEIVPFEHGRALFEAAPEPKQFLEIHGGHNEGFILSGRGYADGLDAFLTEHVAPPAELDDKNADQGRAGGG